MYKINKRPKDDLSDDDEGDEDDEYNDRMITKLAINTVANTISTKFYQYPKLGKIFASQCAEEAFEEMDVLIDDVADGFDESIILEAICQDIMLTISDKDKQPICTTIHHILSTFTLPPKTLNLVELDTKLCRKDIQNIKQMISTQVRYLQPHHSEDGFLIKVLAIGQKNRFPLMTYLMDTFNRWKILKCIRRYEKLRQFRSLSNKKRFIAKKFKSIQLTDFFNNTTSLKQLLLKTREHSNIKQDMTNYKFTMIKIFREIWPSFNYYHPIYKINDSLNIFVMYYISALLSVNKLMANSLTKLPLQIDIWIIPKAVTELYDFGDVDNVQYSDDLDAMLENVDNLQKIEIPNDERSMNKLMEIFDGIYQNVIKYERGKRMVAIIDRRGDNDTLYAYLPKKMQYEEYRGMDMQNIPNGNYLDEMMLVLTKLKVLHEYVDTNWKYGDTNYENIFLVSIQVHKQDLVRAYWRFGQQYTRFYIDDMLDLWPIYFIKKDGVDFDAQIDDNDLKPIIKLIHSIGNRLPLKDVNFDQFFKINTAMDVKRTKSSVIDIYAMKRLVEGYAFTENKGIVVPADICAMIREWMGQICSCHTCSA